MKITYKTNVLDVIRLVENNTPALWEKDTQKGLRAGQSGSCLLVFMKIPYTIDNTLI